MSDLVTRLRGAADAAARTLSGNSMMPPEMSGLGDAEAEDLVFLCRDASDRIEALEAEVESLRVALKPFAEAAEGIDETCHADWEMWEHPAAMNVYVRDFRLAATALEQRLRDAGVETREENADG